MTKLKKLNADWNSGINDQTILELINLEELSSIGNEKINNVKHLTKLKKWRTKY